jgi:hypothetical protein
LRGAHSPTCDRRLIAALEPSGQAPKGAVCRRE